MGPEQDAMRALDRYQSAVDHATVGAGDLDNAYDWLPRGVGRAERHELDAGFFAPTRLKTIAHKDPVLERPLFRELRERLDRTAGSR
jgi:hypothetical protein